MALECEMNAAQRNFLHFTTPQEKEHLLTIKTWTAQCKDKLNILPYEAASDANKLKRFLTTHTFFMVRYAPEELYIKSKIFIKRILPVKLSALFITAKFFIKNSVNLFFII